MSDNEDRGSNFKSIRKITEKNIFEENSKNI
jgi:hypothetical protein